MRKTNTNNVVCIEVGRKKIQEKTRREKNAMDRNRFIDRVRLCLIGVYDLQELNNSHQVGELVESFKKYTLTDLWCLLRCTTERDWNVLPEYYWALTCALREKKHPHSKT